MGTQRTSNKDVLNSINGLSDQMATLIGLLSAQAQAPAQVATPVTEPARNVEAPTVKVPADYHKHQVAKAAEHAKRQGQDVVVYTRRNGKGELKIAYCLASRFATLRDNGLIGAIDYVNADGSVKA